MLQWSNYIPVIQGDLTGSPPQEETVGRVIEQWDRATAVLEEAQPPELAMDAHALLLKKWLEGKAYVLEIQKAVEATPAQDYTAALLDCLGTINEALNLSGDITGTSM